MRLCCVLLALALPLACVAARADDAPAETSLAAWVHTLSNYGGSKAERVAARKGIAALAPEARAQQVVRTLLSDPLPNARIEGARIACVMGRRGHALLPDLLENLRDRVPSVRQEAVLAIGVLESQPGRGPSSAVPRGRVVRLLRDPAPSVRGAALESLARLGALDTDAVVDRLLDTTWAGETFPVLFRRGAEATFTVQALLAAPSWHVREQVLRALRFYARLKATKHIEPSWFSLVRGRAHDDLSTAVRVIALGLLGDFGGRGMDVMRPVLRAMSADRPGVRATAYGVADRLELASEEPVAQLLVERLSAVDGRERAAAAWMLRHASPEDADVDDALRDRLRDVRPSVVIQAAAALLDRGRSDAVLLPHLIGFVASTGVTWPFPEPTLSAWVRDLGGGRKRFDYPSYPAFFPSPRWCARTVARVGAISVAPLMARLAADGPAARIRWIHALGHAGASGRALLASKAAKLTPAESFELGLMRVHAGEADAALVAVMLRAVQAGPNTELTEEAARDDGHDGSYDARRKHALALDALVKLAPVSIDVLVAAMAGAKANEKGWTPDWVQDLQRALRAIGKPALPAVQRAAADGETGYLFTGLAERLKGK